MGKDKKSDSYISIEEIPEGLLVDVFKKGPYKELKIEKNNEYRIIATFCSQRLKGHYVLMRTERHEEIDPVKKTTDVCESSLNFDLLHKEQKHLIPKKLYERAKGFAQKESKRLKIKNIEDCVKSL